MGQNVKMVEKENWNVTYNYKKETTDLIIEIS
jgi:hypothetical protein